MGETRADDRGLERGQARAGKSRILWNSHHYRSGEPPLCNGEKALGNAWRLFGRGLRWSCAEDMGRQKLRMRSDSHLSREKEFFDLGTETGASCSQDSKTECICRAQNSCIAAVIHRFDL